MNGRAESAWVKLLREELSHVSGDYVEVRAALAQARKIFHRELAQAFQPHLNAELFALPQNDYEQMKALASWVNRETRELGLAIRGQKVGGPAIVQASYRDREETSARFRIVETSEAGVRQYANLPRLQDVQLTVDAPRREGPAERFRRDRGGR
jgi:hypothetical protein